MKLLSILLATPLVLLTSSMFSAPTAAQWSSCVVQGELEETDPTLRGTNAPYDIHRFTASRGQHIFVVAESTYFNSGIALFKVNDDNTFTMIDSDATGTDWQQFTAWIYEDGEYAIRIASVNYQDPSRRSPARKYGYYTLTFSPFTCS